jgi:hypothetical protein
MIPGWPTFGSSSIGSQGLELDGGEAVSAPGFERRCEVDFNHENEGLCEDLFISKGSEGLGLIRSGSCTKLMDLSTFESVEPRSLEP